jgi:hypothetical protein
VTKPPTQKAGPQLPGESWFLRFSNRKYPAKDVIRAVGQLHAADRHGEIVALINAALATGQSQPWMYDVLPMSMKLAGRPQSEIDRALTTRVDFTTTDVPSLLYAAAMIQNDLNRTRWR